MGQRINQRPSKRIFETKKKIVGSLKNLSHHTQRLIKKGNH
jgi:hypothetical protein